MAVRITVFAFVLIVCLLLVTEARKMDFLPSDEDEYCHYLGECNNSNDANEDCMTKCTKNGFVSAGAFCKIFVTPMCCCLRDKKSSIANAYPSDNNRYCHYLGTCANQNDCMTNCTNNGFHAGANCAPVATFICCCLKG